MKKLRLSQHVQKTLRLVCFMGTLLGTSLSFISGLMLFMIKHEVIKLEKTSSTVKARLKKLLQEHVVLVSEWAYLTRPERIEKLLPFLKDHALLTAKQITKTL